MSPSQNLAADIIARFSQSVAVGAEADCWPWLGGLRPDGYGYFYLDGRMRRAHRVAYLIAYGEWPEPVGRHTCDNPPCCNPAHILPGTQADNIADMVHRNRTASGLRNGTHTHPETTPRGLRHWTHIRPESRARGEKHGRAVLTEADVNRIRELRKSGQPHRAIAEIFGVCREQIRDICSGKYWSHV